MGCTTTAGKFQRKAEELLSAPADTNTSGQRPSWNQAAEGTERKIPVWGEVITEEHLQGLPKIVQDYLRVTGVVGQPMARTISLRQTGAIRLGPEKDWMPLRAVQVYNAETLEFVWYAHVSMKGPLSFKGLDSLRKDRGGMTIKLLDLIKVVDARGPEIDQGSRMRFLNEMMWFPTAFLHPAVRWEEAGPRQARVSLDFSDTPGQIREEAVITFNEEGLLSNFSALRYADQGKERAALTPWETPITAYGTYNGLRLPSEGYALWRIPASDSAREKDEEFVYIKLKIESINPAAEKTASRLRP